MKRLEILKLSLVKVFANRLNFLWLLIIAAAIFMLLLMIPVWTTPSNDIAFQLSLLSLAVLLLMIVLSFSNALLILMQIYASRHEKKDKILAVKETGMSIGTLGTALFATIGCGACYSSFLALFGLGGTAFIVENRWWFATLAILFSFLAIYYAARRLTGACTVCAK